MTRIALVLATFGYVGYFPIAPGTAGSLAAIPLYVLLRRVGSPTAEAAAIVLVMAAGVWAATRSEGHF